MSEKPTDKAYYLGISKAPEIQVAMWVDGKTKCEYCGAVYKSVDDFIARQVKRGYGKSMTFVDGYCWDEYVKTHQHRVS